MVKECTNKQKIEDAGQKLLDQAMKKGKGDLLFAKFALWKAIEKANAMLKHSG